MNKQKHLQCLIITPLAPNDGYVVTIKNNKGEIMKKILASIPFGRLGKPSEVAGAVAYLVSEDADYITGQIIDINGGLYI